MIGSIKGIITIILVIITEVRMANTFTYTFIDTCANINIHHVSTNKYQVKIIRILKIDGIR